MRKATRVLPDSPAISKARLLCHPAHSICGQCECTIPFCEVDAFISQRMTGSLR